MIRINKHTFVFLLGLNLFAVIFLSHNFYLYESDNHHRITTEKAKEDFSSYQFIDPSVAYQVLEELDIFEVFRDPNLSDERAKEIYSRPYLGVTVDDNYCKRHRAYFVNNPAKFFVDKNFMTNYRAKAIFRYEVIPKMGGRDVMPFVHSKMPEDFQDLFMYDLRDDLQMFFTSSSLCEYRIVGKQFSCLNQESNHIPAMIIYIERITLEEPWLSMERSMNRSPNALMTRNSSQRLGLCLMKTIAEISLRHLIVKSMKS